MDMNTYLKMSQFTLTKQFTSTKDKDGNWIARRGREQLHNLRELMEGNNIGLAFQIQDDVCDNENIDFWQDSIERENHLKNLKKQIIADLVSIEIISPKKNQPLIELITALFTKESIENNYQLDREKSFL